MTHDNDGDVMQMVFSRDCPDRRARAADGDLGGYSEAEQRRALDNLLDAMLPPDALLNEGGGNEWDWIETD